MQLSANTRKIGASFCAAIALALATGPAAAAQEQEALPPAQQYDYACGHLGSSCGADESTPARKRARRSCGKRSRTSRGQRRTATRRCGSTRRSRARR